MSAVTVNLLSPPSSRKTIAPKMPRTQSSQKTKLQMNRTTTETKGQQSAEKKAFNVFDCKSSSESTSDTEMSAATINYLSPPSSRKTIAPMMRRTRSSQKTNPKMAVHNNESSPSGSDLSGLVEASRKSLAKSVDNSRKGQKSKVLPQPSYSSGDENKPSKMAKLSKDKEMKSDNKQKRGVAKSLSFSELNLPGVSVLLTPHNFHPQTSGTVYLSDLDQDTMDPLVDDSFVDQLEGAKPSDTASKMDIGSNEDQMGNPSADLEGEVFHSDTCESEMTECSFIPSLETFTANLKKTLMDSYKKMEVRAQDGLKTTYERVSTLLTEMQESNNLRPTNLGRIISTRLLLLFRTGRLRNLDNLHAVVAEHVSSLQFQNKAFIKLEKDSMDFWEAQTLKAMEFCNNQRLSIEAIERAVPEALNLLKQAEEITIDAVKESLQKL
ncbi:synaptonemal complex protein 2-like isoform X3 [Ranitomeya variabilis]|uniref:synaptonemal complex protein 2-like isoform X3 n=1 Tax=Ranitomeya variabilis TaxID=490064 RepID=UPI004056E813